MKRSVIACIVGVCLALVTTACSSSPLQYGVGPSSLGTGGTATASSPGITCSDSATMLTANHSTSRRGFRVDWAAGPGAQTFEVEVSYSRNGSPARVIQTFRTNRSNAVITDSEDGGVYSVRVRVTHTDCGDVEGAWSRTVVIEVDGRANDGTTTPAPVDDGDTDDSDDEEDDTNPGQGGDNDGDNDGGNGNGNNDDHDNGHGNDDDDTDDSNPGGGKGKGKK